MFMYSMRHKSGFVMMIILLFLQLFSALGLFGLLTSHRALKMLNLSSQSHHHWFLARRTLQKVQFKILQNDHVDCLYQAMAVETLIKQTSEWWQARACNGKVANESYYYIVEPLKEDACAYVRNAYNNQVDKAKYYRITLRLQQVLLQSTFVKAVSIGELCKDKPHFVLQGQQMWREWM